MLENSGATVQEILASAARGTSGVTNGYNFEDAIELIIFAEVSAASGGSPTLDITIQTSHDNTNWASLSTFTQITAASNSIKAVTNYGKYIRASYTIAGTTPSFTFKLTAVRKVY